MDDTNPMNDTRERGWSKLTLGALSPEEAAELQREDPERYERCRPLGPDGEARILARVEETLAAEARARAAAPRSRRRPARLFDLSGWRLAGAGVALGAAAAFVVPRLASEGALLSFVSPTRLDVSYVVSPPRGDGPAVPTLDKPGARIEEVLAPVSRIEGQVAFRGAILLHPESGIVRPLHLDLKPTESKEFFLSGTRAELFPGVASGDWDMLIAVGRPGPPLSESEIRKLADQGSVGDHQVLRMRVVLRGACVGTADQPCIESTPRPATSRGG